MTKRGPAGGDGPKKLTADLPAGVLNGIVRACRTRPRPGLRFDHELTIGTTGAGIDISTRGLIHGGVRTSIRTFSDDDGVEETPWRGVRIEGPQLEAATAGNRAGKWTVTADPDTGTLVIEGGDANGRIKSTIRNEWASAGEHDVPIPVADGGEPIHTVTLATFHVMAARLRGLDGLGAVEVRPMEDRGARWTLHGQGFRIDVDTPAEPGARTPRDGGSLIELPLQALLEFDAACATDYGECEVRLNSLSRTWGSRLKTVTTTRWRESGRGNAGKDRLPEGPDDGATAVTRLHGDAARCVIERLAGINAALGNAASVARIRNTGKELGIEAELTLGNGYPAATVQRTSSPTNGREYEAGPWTAWVHLDVWRRAINALKTHGAARHACNDFDVFESTDDQVIFLKNAGMWDGDPGRGGVTVAMATERK